MPKKMSAKNQGGLFENLFLKGVLNKPSWYNEEFVKI